MKQKIKDIMSEYLEIFPEEIDRQSILLNYLKKYTDSELIDWNNFNGHIVASGFIFAKEQNRFLVLYHKDLKMYLYSGGHIDSNDNNILESAEREVKEETGLKILKLLKITDNKLIPIDIDTHMIDYNQILKLPKHYHFDFRYLFMIENIKDIEIDTQELSDYKWISIEELANDKNFGTIINKINRILNTKI